MNGKAVAAIVIFGLIVSGVMAWFLYGWFESINKGLGWVGIALSLALVAFVFGGLFRAMMTKR